MAKESLRNVLGWALAYGLLGRVRGWPRLPLVAKARQLRSRTRGQAAREMRAPQTAPGGNTEPAARPSSVAERTFR